MMNLKHWTWCLTLIRMKYDADFYKRFGDIIVANTITTAPCWMSFLETMARNSKCTMPELLMIHYQRPEAHDCKKLSGLDQCGATGEAWCHRDSDPGQRQSR